MNLVTGATGLLGSHLCEQLIQRGQTVRGLARAGSDTAFLRSLGVEIATGDVTEPATLASAMAGVRRVYHAAARVGDWGPWPEFVAITIGGTANMLAAAQAARVERFLHISSISAYGHPDGAGLVLDETAPLGQDLHRWSYYSRAKVEAEKLVWAAQARGELAITVCRPSWLYGPRDRASMPRLLRAILTKKAKIIGPGGNRLNLTHAANEAEGCILAAEHPDAVGQAYNLSNDGVITQQEYFDRMSDALGAPRVQRHVPYAVAKNAALLMEIAGHALKQKKPPLVTRYAVWLMGRRCFFSCEKARQQLGWQPTINYEDGIRDAVAWCKANVQLTIDN